MNEQRKWKLYEGILDLKSQNSTRGAEPIGDKYIEIITKN